MQPPFKGVSQYQYKDTRFVFDDSIFPFFCVRQYGPGVPDTLRLIYQVRKPITDHAAKLGTKAIMIFDINEMPAPDAVSRKGVAEIAKVGEAVPGFLTTIVIVPNPLLRGVVTAIAWMGVTDLASAANTADAIKRGKKLYRNEVVDVDESYNIPEWDDRRVIKEVSLSDIKWNIEDAGTSS